jgi:hypothetical protein
MHGGWMRSKTGKLPKGESYPLKPSALEAALTTAGIEIDTYLVRSRSNMFDAYFYPPNLNVPYERLYIRVGSVPAEQTQAARTRMYSDVLPALIKWIGNILAQDINSPVRREQQNFSWVAF